MKRWCKVPGESMVKEKGLAYLLTLVLGFSVSCEDEAEFASLDGHAPGITDGVRDDGHPSVGLLSNQCTATLIGPRSVLTAAHCVRQGRSATFRVAGRAYSSSKVIVHNTADIALVMLKDRVSGVEPSPVNIVKPKVGQRIYIVGFGVTSENGGGFGTKRKGSNTISRVTSTMIYFAGSGGGDSSNCYGDSGGPGFLVIDGREVVAGVTSGGQSPCGTYAYDTRVDVFVDWLESQSNGDIVFPGQGQDDGEGDGGDGGGGVAPCEDNRRFVDAQGYDCDGWVGYDCDDADRVWGYSSSQEQKIKDNCPKTCGLCDGGGNGDSDLCPNDPNKIEPGVCGCGVSDKDSDNDGTPNCNDECPSDRNKTEPGQCGCGRAEGTCGGGADCQDDYRDCHRWSHDGFCADRIWGGWMEDHCCESCAHMR